MKSKKLTIVSFATLLIASKTFAQFGLAPLQNTSTQTTGGDVGIGTGAPASKLDILSVNNQLRLSYSNTSFSNISTNNTGNLIFTPPTNGKVGFGINPTGTNVGFQSNLGAFFITNPTSFATRGITLQPNQTPGGDIPFGSSIAANITTAGEGLSISAGSTNGVKLGAYAYCGLTNGWRSIWETSNVSSGFANLLLVRSGGNVGIGTNAPGVGSKLDIIGKIKVTDGTQGIGKVLTSDASGLASWATVNGLLSGGTANYIPKWTSSNSLSSTSLIYDDGTNIGIGTNIPSKRLHVNGDAQIGNLALTTANNNSLIDVSNDLYVNYNSRKNTNINIAWILQTNPNTGVTTTIQDGGQVNMGAKVAMAGSLKMGWDGNGVDLNTSMEVNQNNQNANAIKVKTWNNSIKAFSVELPNAQNTFVVYGEGNTKINTNAVSAFEISDLATNTTNFKVKNTGVVYAREINVQLGVFPDYVFANDYKLTPLNEVEEYISKNKHLRGFESGNKYEANGMNVGEIVRLQQEKIEEITLYLIELKKELNALKKEKNNTK